MELGRKSGKFKKKIHFQLDFDTESEGNIFLDQENNKNPVGSPVKFLYCCVAGRSGNTTSGQD